MRIRLNAAKANVKATLTRARPRTLTSASPAKALDPAAPPLDSLAAALTDRRTDVTRYMVVDRRLARLAILPRCLSMAMSGLTDRARNEATN